MRCLPLLTTNGSERSCLGSESTLSSIAEKFCSKIGNDILKEACVFNDIVAGGIKLVFSEIFNA